MMAKLLSKRGPALSPLTGESARSSQAALDLCRVAQRLSPVRVDSVEDGYSISWVGGKGNLVVRPLTEFLIEHTRSGFRGDEASVYSSLKERAGVAGSECEGSFSFVGPGESDYPAHYDITVESFDTSSGEAIALTIHAEPASILSGGLLFKSTD